MKKLMLVLGAALVVGLALSIYHPVHAATVSDIITNKVCDSTSNQLSGCTNGKSLTGGGDPSKSYINDFIGALEYITIGIATVFMFIAGINHITSEGDPEKLGRARKTLIYGAVAIMITVGARAIAGFIIGAANK